MGVEIIEDPAHGTHQERVFIDILDIVVANDFENAREQTQILVALRFDDGFSARLSPTDQAAGGDRDGETQYEGCQKTWGA